MKTEVQPITEVKTSPRSDAEEEDREDIIKMYTRVICEVMELDYEGARDTNDSL